MNTKIKIVVIGLCLFIVSCGGDSKFVNKSERAKILKYKVKSISE